MLKSISVLRRHRDWGLRREKIPFSLGGLQGLPNLGPILNYSDGENEHLRGKMSYSRDLVYITAGGGVGKLWVRPSGEWQIVTISYASSKWFSPFAWKARLRRILRLCPAQEERVLWLISDVCHGLGIEHWYHVLIFPSLKVCDFLLQGNPE